MPTWCNPASIRSCHGRDPGSNPGVGVDAWRGHVGVPIEGGIRRRRDHHRSFGGNRPRRVCNLHAPVWYSRDSPKYAPMMRRATGAFWSRLRSWKQSYRQTTNCRDLGSPCEPIVQPMTICALDVQNRGSNSRRLRVSCLGNGDPTGLLRQPRRWVPGSTPGHGVVRHTDRRPRLV